MRPVLPLASCLVLVLAGPAIAAAADDVSVKPGRVFVAQGYTQILAQVVNSGASLIGKVEVTCDAYDKALGPVGTAFQYVHRLAAGQNAIAEVLVRNPPSVVPTQPYAECRITEAE